MTGLTKNHDGEELCPVCRTPFAERTDEGGLVKYNHRDLNGNRTCETLPVADPATPRQ